MPEHADATDRPNDHAALQEARERARQAKRQLRKELIHQSGATEETKLQAAEVALDYRDLLIDYKQELGDEKWAEADVDWPTELVGAQVPRQQERPGRGRGVSRGAAPKFAEVDGERLYKLLKNLDVIWRALGFGAETDDDTLESFEVGDP